MLSIPTTTHYMVNPSTLMPPPQTTIMPFPRKREQTSSPEDSEEEEEYQPGPPTSSSKRAKKVPSGNGGGKGTKMSREALRKANHSLIERRRREKINFALGELRGMVPGLGDEKGGKAGEFKLEVCLSFPLLFLMSWTLTSTGTGTDCRTYERPQGRDNRASS